MEHIDSRIQVNPKRLKTLELIRQKYQLNAALNSAFMSLLILFGIIGVLTVLYLQASHAAQQSEKKVNLTANRQLGNPQAKPVLLTDTAVAPAEFVKISGELKSKSAISIVIDSYDPKANYQLDMGNGKIMNLEKKTTEITYAGPGIYYPVMEISFQGESQKLPLEKLWVR